MGLLSDYGDSQGGIGGLLGQPPAFGMDPNGPTAALLKALLSQGGPGYAPSPPSDGSFGQPGYAGSPEASSPMPQFSAPPSQYGPQGGLLPDQPNPSAPPAANHPGLLDGVGHFFGGLLNGSGGQQPGGPAPQPPRGGLLGDVVSGVGSAIKLPFDLVRGYAASAADVPDRIAFERQERAYQLNAARQNMALVGSLIGGGGGGLFGGGASQSAPPSGGPPPVSAPVSYAAPSPPQFSGGSGVPPRAVAVTPPGGAPPFGSPIGAPQLAAGSGGAPGGLDIRNPNTQRTLAALDLLGNPAGAQLATLGASVLPRYSAARPGGMVLNESTGRFEGPSVPQDGTYNVPLTDGTFRNIPVAGAATNNAAYQGAAAGGRAAGEAIGKLPYVGPTAQAQAAGTGAGEAPYRMVTVPMPDGSTRTMSQAQYLALTGGAGAPGAAAAGLGVSQSPAAAAYSGDQAKQLSDTIATDQNGRQAAMQQRDNGQRAINLASQTPFNPGAPLKYNLEKIGATLGLPSQEMNRYANYQQLATQGILSYAKSNLPTRFTEREIGLVTPVIGSIKDPNVAALVSGGIQTAVANKALARAQLADNYQGPLTKQAYEAAWGASPAGRASLFQDPVWQNVKVGGLPFVQSTDAKGNPLVFKGQRYIAVGAGLGKPTYLPAY